LPGDHVLSDHAVIDALGRFERVVLGLQAAASCADPTLPAQQPRFSWAQARSLEARLAGCDLGRETVTQTMTTMMTMVTPRLKMSPAVIREPDE
jgi:hypothetical protein